MKPWVALFSSSLIAVGFVAAAAIFRSGRCEEPPPRVSTPPPPPSGDADGGALRQEVAALRAEVRALREERAAEEAKRRQEQKPPGDAAPPLFALPPPPNPEDLPVLQATALDPNRPPEERLKALSRLRSAPAGRTREVVAAMLQLLDQSQDAGIRADILRDLHRALPGDLKGPVLQRMQLDTDAKVREEAAETLGPLKADPAVKAALEQSAQNDPDLKVRAQALKSLGDRR